MPKRFYFIFILLIGLFAQLHAQSCDDKLFPIVKDRKLGFIDKAGREVIPARFGDYSNVQYFPDLPKFSEGLAAVSQKDRWGYIDCSGKFAIAPQFGSARPFSNGLAAVREGSYPATAGKAMWIDHNGHIAYAGQVRHFQTDFHEGLLLLADEKNSWEPGYVDRNFQWKVPSQAVFRSGFHEGFAIFGTGDAASRKFGFINASGKVVIPAKYDRVSDFNDGLAGACLWAQGASGANAKLWRCGFVDANGQEVIPLQFNSVSSFSDGVALVQSQAGQTAIINKAGTIVRTLADMEVPGQFHEGLAVSRKGGQVGFINLQGEWAIPPRFAGATDFSHGMAMVQLSDHQYGYIDIHGKLVWQARTSVPPMVFIPSTFAAGAR
jgi:hypothetical protein